MSSFEDFKKTLLELEPGERRVYHIGNLAEDRVRQSTVHKIAVLARGLQLFGAATLTSQRLDANQTAYYITLLRHTARPPHGETDLTRTWANEARRLQDVDLTRAWTLGQESLAA